MKVSWGGTRVGGGRPLWAVGGGRPLGGKVAGQPPGIGLTCASLADRMLLQGARVMRPTTETQKKQKDMQLRPKEVWRGPSPYNGETIRATISRGSLNKKTGYLDSMWIHVDGVAPSEAVETGRDSAVCGDCPHRPGGSLGDCYATQGQSWMGGQSHARSISRDYDRGRSHVLRLGAYGDPAMLPESVVAGEVRKYRGRALGYTHQWQHAWAGWARAYCMASADSMDQAREAQAAGWRTFRVSYDGEMMPGEILCPSDKGVQCADCGLCDGKRGPDDRRKNIAILAHGARSQPLLKV